MALLKQRMEAALGVTFWLALAAVLSVLVSVWALARPEADPVGQLMGRITQAAGTHADWLRQGGTRTHPDWEAESLTVAGGDARQGARLIARHGCGACHIVPGIARAEGTVGPDLTGFRDRAYVGGVLPNRPGDLVNWLQSPPRHAPETAMPDMGLTEAEAGHMAAYLYTLGGR